VVRYIHLNPLRASIVSDLTELDQFRYCGHSAIIGIADRSWQDTGFVLSSFSGNGNESRMVYRSYVEAGILQSKREDLAGGGLVRSLDGWKPIGLNDQKIKGD
jgi:putative transposase